MYIHLEFQEVYSLDYEKRDFNFRVTLVRIYYSTMCGAEIMCY